VDTSAPRNVKTKRPTVGLDEPCRECGDPIYYNYRGPVEGLCGKCTDRMRKAGHRRKGLRPMGAPGGGGGLRLGLVIVLAFAAGAVAGYLLHALFPVVTFGSS
jgi:hypothetical protein